MSAVIEAGEAVGVKLPRSQRMVLDMLLARQRHGNADTTDHEIRDLLEQVHAPRRFDTGWVSARVSEMLQGRVIEQSSSKREDAHTRHSAAATGRTTLVRAVFIPATQRRLVA